MCVTYNNIGVSHTPVQWSPPQPSVTPRPCLLWGVCERGETTRADGCVPDAVRAPSVQRTFRWKSAIPGQTSHGAGSLSGAAGGASGSTLLFKSSLRVCGAFLFLLYHQPPHILQGEHRYTEKPSTEQLETETARCLHTCAKQRENQTGRQ